MCSSPPVLVGTGAAEYRRARGRPADRLRPPGDRGPAAGAAGHVPGAPRRRTPVAGVPGHQGGPLLPGGRQDRPEGTGTQLLPMSVAYPLVDWLITEYGKVSPKAIN